MQKEELWGLSKLREGVGGREASPVWVIQGSPRLGKRLLIKEIRVSAKDQRKGQRCEWGPASALGGAAD